MSPKNVYHRNFSTWLNFNSFFRPTNQLFPFLKTNTENKIYYQVFPTRFIFFPDIWRLWCTFGSRKTRNLVVKIHKLQKKVFLNIILAFIDLQVLMDLPTLLWKRFLGKFRFLMTENCILPDTSISATKFTILSFYRFIYNAII